MRPQPPHKPGALPAPTPAPRCTKHRSQSGTTAAGARPVTHLGHPHSASPAVLCPHPARMHPSSWLVGDQFAPSMTVHPNPVSPALPHWGGCAHTGTQQAVKCCLPSPWACTHPQDLWAPLYCSAHTQGGMCSMGTQSGTSLAPVHVLLWFLALSFPKETICIQPRHKLLNSCMYQCTHTHTRTHAQTCTSLQI